MSAAMLRESSVSFQLMLVRYGHQKGQTGEVQASKVDHSPVGDRITAHQDGSSARGPWDRARVKSPSDSTGDFIRYECY